MKKVILLFLCFSFLFSISIDRPWDQDYWANQNQYIMTFLSYEVWNSNKMHEVLEGLSLEEISDLDNEEFSDAIINYNSATYSDSQCTLLGERAFSTYLILSPEIILMELTYKQITESTITECASYSTYWRNTMNSALDSLENYYGELENGCSYANSIYYDMDYSGLCDYSQEECDDLEEVVNNCNGDYYFGEFSEIYTVKELVNELENKLQEEKPVLSEYKESMDILSSGLIAEINSMANEGKENLELNKQEFTLLKNEVSSLENKASAKYSELEKHNLDKITSGSIISGYLEEEVISIPLEFELIKENLESADGLVEEAKIYYSLENKNYLKNSIENLKYAKEVYADSYDELDFLESEVIDIVETKKMEAQETMNLFMNKVGSTVLDSKTELLFAYAEEYYFYAEDGDRYGDKYFYYREAIKYTNLAEISFGTYSGEEELVFFSELSSLKLLINNAENDELSMEYEKQMSGYLEDHPDASMIGVIDELIEGIISKAELRYSYLEEERKEIRDLIEISEEDFGYFLSVLEEKEQNIFISSKIDYLNGIGRLKELEESYSEIKEEILFEINNVLPSKLGLKQSVWINDCGVGENCEVRLEIEISNPYNLLLESPKVPVSLPFELMLYKSNVEIGEEHLNDVTVDDETLNLYFYEIKPLQTYYLSISKNTILILIEELELNSIGNPDGSANLEYEYSLDSLYDVSYPIVPSISGELKKIELDGVPVNYDEERIQTTLSEGKHELFVKTFMEDAFSIEKTSVYATEIGLKKKVNYDLEITPKIDLDKASLVLDEGFNDEVEDLSVISYSGNTIKNKKATNSGQYSFDIYDLKTDETAIVRVEYLVDDPSNYLEEELEKIELKDLSEENQELLDEINDAIANNDSTTAIKKIKELENAIEKEEQALNKLQTKFDSALSIIEEEISEIEELINQNISIEDEFITKLEFRKSELEEILDSYSGISEENLTILEDVDEKWMGKEIKNFIKRMYSEYNEIKSQLIELDFVDEIREELYNFEDNLMELEVTQDLEKVPEILNSLEYFEGYLEEKLSSLEGNRDEKKQEFYDLRDSILSYMELYELQYSDAEDSEFEYLFSYNPGEIESKLEETEEDLEDFSSEELEQELEQIRAIESSVEEVLDYVETESKRRVREIEMLYTSMELEEQEKEKIDNAILKLNQMIGEERYVAVLKGSELLLKGEYDFGEEEEGEMILLAVTIFLIVIMVIYLLKDKLPLKKKKGKELKKLERVEE